MFEHLYARQGASRRTRGITPFATYGRRSPHVALHHKFAYTSEQDRMVSKQEVACPHLSRARPLLRRFLRLPAACLHGSTPAEGGTDSFHPRTNKSRIPYHVTPVVSQLGQSYLIKSSRGRLPPSLRSLPLSPYVPSSFLPRLLESFSSPALSPD